MILLFFQNIEAKIERKLRIPSGFMSYHKTDSSHIVDYLAKSQQNFSNVEYSYKH